jgi:hypothetical protein
MLTRFHSGAVWLSIIGLSAVAAYGADEGDQGAQSPTLTRVFAAWNARQARIKAFHVTWDLRIRLPRGSALPRWAGFLGSGGWGFAGLRPKISESGEDQDVELTLPQSEWWGEGPDRLRSDFGEFAPSSDGGWKEAGQLCVVADGSRHLRLRVPASADELPTLAVWRIVPVKNPSSTMTSGDSLLAKREVDLVPLRFALRPAGLAPDWSQDNCRVVSENAVLDGVRCIEIQLDKIAYSDRCWVDPSRDYSVVRWERRQPGFPPLEITIDLESRSNREWAPTRWSWRFSGEGGAPAASFEATVRSCTILNQNLPEGTFSPTGPPGTRVFDATVDLPILDTGEHSGMEPPEKAGATLAAIADAWMRRQTTIKSFKFAWQRKAQSIFASQGVFRTTVHSVAMDREKFASTFSTPGWTPPASQPATRAKDGTARKMGWEVYESKEVRDGAAWSRLSFSERSGDPGSLSIANDSDRREGMMAGERCVMLVYRPLHPKFGRVDAADLRDPAKFHIVAGTRKIGDVACVVLENEPSPGMHEYYWLDPARDYLPLRESRTLNGEDRDRVDFKYRSDPRDGWVPTGWTVANVGESGLLMVPSTDSVTEATVNRPLPASEFEIDPPRRAQINDSRVDRHSPRERAEDAAREAKRDTSFQIRDARRRAQIKRKQKPIYDPFADAAADLETALKKARETNRRVLIQFGVNRDPDCRDLGAVLKNAEVAPMLNQFVLVPIDVDFDAGKTIQEKYVPKRERYMRPYLTVLDPDGNLLKNDNTNAVESGDSYDIGKVKTFLAEWSAAK